MKIVFKLFLIFLVFQTPVFADESSSRWFSKSTDKQVVINIEMFLSTTCQHCKKADAFLNKMQSKYPYLSIQRYFINQDKNGLNLFYQLLSEQQMGDFAVPSIFFCNSRWVGFSSEETTGKDLLRAINYCKQQIERKGALTSETINVLRHSANANRFINGIVANPSPFHFTIITAIMDSFSPCAFFGFMGFLAFLFIETPKNRRVAASLLFISSVIIVHYFQQVYNSTFFEILPWIRIPAILVGVMAIYFVVQYVNKYFIKGLYLSLAFLLGLMTTIYQQTCMMNWSGVFEQWLRDQNLSNWLTSGYQLLYQVIYILPLILIMIIYLSFIKIKRLAALQPKLNNMGLLFIVAIGLALIFYPLALSYSGISLLILLILMVCGYFFRVDRNK